MFALLDYDVSRYLLNSLGPRMTRAVADGFKPRPVTTSSVDGLDLQRRSQSTMTPAGSGHVQGQGQGQGRGLMRLTSLPSLPKTTSWSRNLVFPLSPFRRGFWGSSKEGDAKKAGRAKDSLTNIAKDSPPCEPCMPVASATPGIPGPLKDCPPAQNSVVSFEHARKFIEIPGPTSAYQVVPFASTRLLYYPFSNAKTEDMGGMLSGLQTKYGPIMRVKVGAQWIVFIETLTDIQNVVSASDQELNNRVSNLTTLPVPRNISPIEKLTKYSKDPVLEWLDAGPKPQRQRNAVSQYLSSSTLLQSQTCQDVMATDLLKQLEKALHFPQEIETLCHRYALENSAQLCFRQRLGLLGDHYAADGQKQQLVESYKMVMRCLGEIQTGTRLFYTLIHDPFANRFREARAYVQSWERRQMRESTIFALQGAKQESLLSEESSLLISLMNDCSVSEEDISDIIHTMMTTRAEASASALVMLLGSLATNMDKQDKLAQDIIKELGQDGAVKPDSLEKLPYLGACIDESLRLYYPMSSGGQVILSNNIVLSNYLIPAGTPIEINSRRTARNPLWYEHPTFYLPERWLGDKASQIPAVTFMPFGFSFRGCPGLEAFFFQETAAAVIKILQRYKIDLPEEYHVDMLKTVHSPFRTPKEPLPFIFSKRGAASKPCEPNPCGPCPPVVDPPCAPTTAPDDKKKAK